MNLKNKLESIKYKSLIYLIIFSVVILFLLWFFQIVFLNVFYERYQIKKIENVSSSLLNSNTSVNSDLETMAYENNMCMEYATFDGMDYKYNIKSPGCELNNNNIINYKKELIESREEKKAITITNTRFNTKAILYMIKVDNGYVFIYSNLSETNQTSIVLRNQLIYITIVVIAVAILISIFLSRKLTKPIENITAKSKELAKGNYDLTFNKVGIKEIDELSETLNFAKTEMAKTDEYRRDLLANVSHDLKTPLTMIKAYAEMVRDITYKDTEKRNEDLNIIIDETDRLNVLVNDILDLSKIQSKKDELNITEFDLIKVINDILNKYKIIKETENYKIILDGPKKAMVEADKSKITQVIYNLVNNAINYTGDDKTVTVKVTTKSKDKNYLVEIIDTGKGIKKDDLEHIWDKYYKNDKNHQRNVVGTGIGLSIVKSVLLTHKFEYGVKSIPKKGSTFYFTIPKCKH